MKDELVHELENKELEMQLLLQKQKAVSSFIYLSIFVFHHRVSVCFLLHLLDILLEPKQDSVERGMAFFVGGEGEDRNDACYLSGKSCRIFIEKG